MKLFYHVTHTYSVRGILSKGLLTCQTSNWIDGLGDRLGNGAIHACDDEDDAIRWGGKMDWEFNKNIGSGLVSIVTLEADCVYWDNDFNDTLQQMSNRGRWWKTSQPVPPIAIRSHTKIDETMIRALIRREQLVTYAQSS